MDVYDKIIKSNHEIVPYSTKNFKLKQVLGDGDCAYHSFIESMNAFVGCNNPEQKHEGQFFICNECGAFVELDSSPINSAITHSAEHSGFEIQQRTIEIMGLCPECKAKQDNK